MLCLVFLATGRDTAAALAVAPAVGLAAADLSVRLLRPAARPNG